MTDPGKWFIMGVWKDAEPPNPLTRRALGIRPLSALSEDGSRAPLPPMWITFRPPNSGRLCVVPANP